MVIHLFCVTLQPETKHLGVMTALAQRIKETPLAPYLGLLRGMTREQKQIVVTFITESMEEPLTAEQVHTNSGKQRGRTTRVGWAAAAKQAHIDGEDILSTADVFEDETMEDWKW